MGWRGPKNSDLLLCISIRKQNRHKTGQSVISGGPVFLSAYPAHQRSWCHCLEEWERIFSGGKPICQASYFTRHCHTINRFRFYLERREQIWNNTIRQARRHGKIGLPRKNLRRCASGMLRSCWPSGAVWTLCWGERCRCLPTVLSTIFPPNQPASNPTRHRKRKGHSFSKHREERTMPRLRKIGLFHRQIFQIFPFWIAMSQYRQRPKTHWGLSKTADAGFLRHRRLRRPGG